MNIIHETLLLIASLFFLILKYSCQHLYKIKKITQNSFICNYISRILLLLSIFFHLLALIIRVTVSKHAPFSNLYESLLFFGFIYRFQFEFIKFKYSTNTVLFIPGISIVSAALLLPNTLKISSELPLILDSPWFFIHVPFSFIAYSQILYGTAMSIAGSDTSDEKWKKIHAEIFIGWLFLTFGIITGAVWGNSAWGSFWNWDPKETSALILWIMLCIFLHIRIISIKRILLLLSFCIVIFTYIGISLLFKGLHSYL